jgi:hypothetical protein
LLKRDQLFSYVFVMPGGGSLTVTGRDGLQRQDQYVRDFMLKTVVCGMVSGVEIGFHV